MTTTWNAGAVARLFALGLAGGILQLTTVSQITVFGVPADLAPLLAASVGLLLGSVPGACFGFGLGLLMDTALAQTLGMVVADGIAVIIGLVIGKRLPTRAIKYGSAGVFIVSGLKSAVEASGAAVPAG